MAVTDYLRPAWFDEARFLVQGPVFEQFLGRHPLSGRVLNAGCGEGLYASILEAQPRVTTIVNVDLSRPAIARHAKDTRHRDAQASVAALPFDAHVFDAAVCSEVLEHIPDDSAAVAELARVLKPGGLLLVSVPTPPAPADPNHVREGYGVEGLTRLLATHGFERLETAHCMHRWMRTLYVVWHRLHRVAGRNLFPRALLRGAAHLDRRTTWGAPWDLVVLARRGSVSKPLQMYPSGDR